MTYAPAICLVAACIALIVAARLVRHQGVAGRRIFGWLMLLLADWSALSALHTLAPDPATKIRLAQIQYFAIVSVPLLWLLVARAAAGRERLGRRTLALLAAIPLTTIGLVWTNGLHGLIWARITPAGAALVYEHGVWFWIAAAYNYGLLLTAQVLLARTLRASPPAFHAPLHALLLAGFLPWIGNILYLIGAIPISGLDPTPIAFVATGALSFWGLTYHHLLRLVPIARSVLIEQLADGVIVLDDQQRIVDHNPAACRLCGLDTLPVGQLLADVLPALMPSAAAARATGAPVLIEGLGSAETSVEVRAMPLAEAPERTVGWLLTLHDVTIPQRLMRQLQAEYDFSRQVMQTMGEGLTVTDPAGRFTFVNDAYARLFGYTPEMLLGRSPLELTIEADRAELEAARSARAAGQTSSYLSRLRCQDGRIATVQVTGSPYVVDGRVVGSIAVITDLSARLAQAEALRIAEQTLRSFFDSAGAMMGIVELLDDDILHIADNALSAAFFGSSVPAMREQRASALGVPPETIRAWIAAYRESERTGRPVQFEYTHQLLAEQRWLAATMAAIGPGENGRTRFSYVVTDVTAQKVIEQKLKEANAQLNTLARTDALTGLLNRRAFDERLAVEVVQANTHHTPLSVFLIDIDRFKSYNDTYGHAVGDQVLRTVGTIFREQSRMIDVAARYGGEEFAFILPNSEAAEAIRIAERIRRSVENAPWRVPPVTISVGVMSISQPMTADDLLRKADQALYRAKDAGRNCVMHAADCCPEHTIT